MTPQLKKIETLIAPTLTDMGFDLVRVMLTGNDSNPTLQIMAESLEDGQMNVDQCADISRSVSALLDVEDIISSAYVLEVSSPGLDRPLTRLKDFTRFVDFDASVELDTPLETGQKRFKGVINNVKESIITLDTQDGIVEFKFDDIYKAKLTLTEKLLKAAQAEQE